MYTGNNMHNVTVAFYDQQITDRNRSARSHSAHIVTAQVHQHQMFGPFLGIGQQFFFKGHVLIRSCAALAGTGNGA